MDRSKPFDHVPEHSVRTVASDRWDSVYDAVYGPVISRLAHGGRVGGPEPAFRHAVQLHELVGRGSGGAQHYGLFGRDVQRELRHEVLSGYLEQPECRR